MGTEDNKRKKNKNDDEDDHPKEKRGKRPRSQSPDKLQGRDRDSRRKRKHSRSASPGKRVKEERQRDEVPKDSEVKKEAPGRKNKETDMLNTRTGGAYIPPARLRMMQAQITDKSSVAYQRLAWEALKKSIHGHINKINVGNIGIIIKQLLKENIVRGRGLLCRSVIQAQAASPTFTNVYAALVAAVNSRFPNIGELLLKRLVIQFKRGFKRNDKAICISSATFVAHLVNQRVAHEILALELLTLLVETPTDDSVEVAIAFLKECGQKLTEVSSKGVNAIFEMLRNILHEGHLDKRVQYMIEVMFQVWKDGFKDHPAVVEELELVPEEEQFTHLLMLDEATDPQDILNVFKFDDKYEENEQKYKTLSKEILGSDAESGEESGESGSDGSDDEEEEGEGEQENKMTIIDNTETNLVALRRTIYLTINSSLDFEECAHKLMKMQLKPGQEVELCHMFLDCCAEQRTYEKFYGLLAQRFCNINRIYIEPFEQIFKDSYGTAHRLDTNRLRNVSKFFAHLLFTDSISWEVLECVRLNEEDTTSSSRIYIKILFQELAEYMGLKKLNDRLKDPTLQEAFTGIFPRDNPKNTRFSINFFTSIGLGGLTDELREHLKQMPKVTPAPVVNVGEEVSSSSSSSSSSSDSSNDSSSSDSEEKSSKKKSVKKKSKSNKKNKDKTPKTPEGEPPKDKDTERWGHDGFYDTYGKDARRIESNKEKDYNFIKPRDKPDRSRNNDERNNRDDNKRRNDNERYNRDDNRRRNDDDRNNRQRDGQDRRRDSDEGYWSRKEDDRSNRDSDRTKGDDSRFRGEGDGTRKGDKSRDNSSSRKDDGRSERDDDQSKRNGDRSKKEDESSRKDYDRPAKEDDGVARKNKDYVRSSDDDKSRKDVRSRREGDDRYDDRSKRDDERSSRKEDEKSSRREDEKSSRKEDKKSFRKEDDHFDDRHDDRSKREGARSKRDDDRYVDRSKKEDARSSREEDDRYDDSHRREDDRSKRNDDRSKREDIRSYRKEDDRYDDRSKKEDVKSSRKEDDRYDDSHRKEDDRYDGRSKRENDRSKREHDRYDDSSRREDERSRKENDRCDDKYKKDDRFRQDDDRRRKEDDRITKEDEVKKEDSKSRKNKKKDKKRKINKENKKSKTESSSSSSSSTSDSESDSSSSEEDRKRKKKQKNKKKTQRPDDWDIRGSSIRREIPNGRYWAD